MSSMRPRFALAAVLALGSLGFAACGGDDSGSSATTGGGGSAATTAPSSTGSGAPSSSGASGDAVAVETWAGSVCGSVDTWLQGINAKGTQLSQDVQGVSDLNKGRDLLVQFMEDAVSLTDEMLSSVEAAGSPDIENGDQLAADLLAALQPVEDTFSQAVDKAKALPDRRPDRVLASRDAARSGDHRLPDRVLSELRPAAGEVRRCRPEPSVQRRPTVRPAGIYDRKLSLQNAQRRALSSGRSASGRG